MGRKKDVGERWLVEEGKTVDLAGIDPAGGGAPGGKRRTQEEAATLRGELADLQARLHAGGRQGLLVVLQAVDAGGKDGTIRNVFSGVNPQGCRVEGFKTPSEEEAAHDFLWRVHAHCPRRGEIAIFNRSHYEAVLAERVHGIVPEEVWRNRYSVIANFERGLAVAGTRIVKLFLHISKDEQAQRFRDRLKNPAKRWKFRRDDLDKRALWAEYQEAYREAIEKTSAQSAPWYVIPADRNWYRDWAVLSILVGTLNDMDPKYPEPEEDLTGIVIR